MDSYSLTSYQLTDLLFRFVAIGQLVFLAVFLTRKQLTQQAVAASCFLFCLMGYLLLTAPIQNNENGLLRSISLTLTEFTPYTLWFFAFSLVNEQFNLKNLNLWFKVLIGAVFCWNVYFFGVLLGRGLFHQLSNLIAIALILHVVYFVLKDWHDDLDDSRRKIRALLLSYIGFYGALLTGIQVVNSQLKDSITFNLINSLFILLSVSFIGAAIIRNRLESKLGEQVNEQCMQTQSTDNEKEKDIDYQLDIPVIYKQAFLLLKERMNSGYFTETSLTISTLADELKIPEHQLRVLINKHLGFRNFSSFLNSYRLPAAKEQLADISKARVPILTIALKLGYGSIGPFNRAFKSAYNQTPSDYRKSFLK